MSADDELKFDPEATNSVMLFLAKHGWFIGDQIVMPEEFYLHLSEKGSSRMREFASLLKKIAPLFFGLPPRTLNSAEFVLGAARIAPELIASLISDRELNAFMVLIACYAKKNPPPTSPPDDPPATPPRF